MKARKLGETQLYVLRMGPEWDMPDSRMKAVLRSLERRGLVDERTWPSPRWVMTEAGREALDLIEAATGAHP